jgi:hypothetical protein
VQHSRSTAASINSAFERDGGSCLADVTRDAPVDAGEARSVRHARLVLGSVVMVLGPCDTPPASGAEVPCGYLSTGLIQDMHDSHVPYGHARIYFGMIFRGLPAHDSRSSLALNKAKIQQLVNAV